MRNAHGETPREVARATILEWARKARDRETGDMDQAEEDYTPSFAREVEAQLGKVHDQLAHQFGFDPVPSPRRVVLK